MSRFGRDYLKVGFYTDVMFRDKGIRFIAVNNGIDSDKQGDNDFTPFLNIRNELYVGDVSGKIPNKRFNRLPVGYDTGQSALEQEALELKEGSTAQAEEHAKAQKALAARNWEREQNKLCICRVREAQRAPKETEKVSSMVD